MVYRTTPVDFGPIIPPAEAVLVHSTRAARQLAAITDLGLVAPTMSAVCISPAAAEPLGEFGFIEILIASSPNEEAMLQALDAWAVGRAPIRLFPLAFWIAIAFALTCIIAAIAVTDLGPQLFPPATSHPATAQPLQIRGKSG